MVKPFPWPCSNALYRKLSPMFQSLTTSCTCTKTRWQRRSKRMMSRPREDSRLLLTLRFAPHRPRIFVLPMVNNCTIHRDLMQQLYTPTCSLCVAAVRGPLEQQQMSDSACLARPFSMKKGIPAHRVWLFFLLASGVAPEWDVRGKQRPRPAAVLAILGRQQGNN